MRIVSLVPSLTHTVAELGRKGDLVGVTNFCVKPSSLSRTATIVGGTKDPDLEAIATLKPDLIIVNSEENRAPDITACRSIAEVVETFPKSPRDVPQMLGKIGEAIDQSAKALAMAKEVTHLLDQVENKYLKNDVTYLYLIWREPYMVAGRDTYISQSLALMGFNNVCFSLERYPEISAQDIEDAQPSKVFFSTEPYPFRKRDALRLLSEATLDQQTLHKIDGQIFSWYGALTVNMLSTMLEGHVSQRMNLD